MVPDYIHPIRHSFHITLPAGQRLERFVYSYFVDGDTPFLIDTGVRGSERIIGNTLVAQGREWRDVRAVFLSHAHPDHFGAAAAIQRMSECPFFIHHREREWVESPEVQFAMRPVPSFHQLIEGPVPIRDVPIQEAIGDVVPAMEMAVIHAPGHSPGHLHFRISDTLFTGDTLLQPGDIPAYHNFFQLKTTLKQLKQTSFSQLLSSWRAPLRRKEARVEIDASLAYLKRIDQAVKRIYPAFDSGASARSDHPPLSFCQRVITELGLPPFMVNPIVHASFRSHFPAMSE